MKRSFTNRTRAIRLRRPVQPDSGLPARVRDRDPENSNSRGTIAILTRQNLSPIPHRKDVAFHFESHFNISIPQFQNNVTQFWSLVSLFDPDYSNAGSNKSVPYFDLMLGNTAGLYQFFRIRYVDVRVRVLATGANTYPTVVLRPTAQGTSEFPTSAYIHNLAGAPMAVTRSLENNGDTRWSEFVYRVYPWEILGIEKRVWDEDTHYLYAFNQNNSEPPWLAISVGDGNAATGSGAAMGVTGRIVLDYHATLSNPMVTTAV